MARSFRMGRLAYGLVQARDILLPPDDVRVARDRLARIDGLDEYTLRRMLDDNGLLPLSYRAGDDLLELLARAWVQRLITVIEHRQPERLLDGPEVRDLVPPRTLGELPTRPAPGPEPGETTPTWVSFEVVDEQGNPADGVFRCQLDARLEGGELQQEPHRFEELKRGASAQVYLEMLQWPVDPLAVIDDGPSAEPSTTGEVDTWFEVRLVDRAGAPLVAVPLSFELGGQEQPHETDEDGRVRIESARAPAARVEVAASDALNQALREIQRSPGAMNRDADARYAGARIGPFELAGASPREICLERRDPVEVLELPGIHFGWNRSVLVFDASPPDERGFRATTRAVVRRLLEHLEASTERRVLVVGHTDTSGGEKNNLVVSERRALSVAAYLSCDRDTWIADASEHGAVEDQQSVLKWAAYQMGWGCDPGEIDGDFGPDSKEALTSFRVSASTRLSRPLPDSGPFGAEDWGGIYDLYDHAAADLMHIDVEELVSKKRSIELVAVDPVGAGEAFPKEAIGTNGFRCEDNRRADILLFDPDAAESVEGADDPAATIYGGGFDATMLETPVERSVRIVVKDTAGSRCPFAHVHVEFSGRVVTLECDAEGVAVVDGMKGEEIAVVRVEGVDGKHPIRLDPMGNA